MKDNITDLIKSCRFRSFSQLMNSFLYQKSYKANAKHNGVNLKYHRFLINSMNWTILEPINPRKLRPAILRELGATVGKDLFIGDYVCVDLNHSNLIANEDGVHFVGDVYLPCHKKDLANYASDKTYGMQPWYNGEIHLCKNCA